VKELPVDGAVVGGGGEREREGEGASLYKERSAIYSC
jgi:hypothetical protein